MEDIPGQIHPEITNDGETKIKEPNKVLLFNDDYHSFQEVILQLVKALRCTIEKAYDLTMEAHMNGKTIIYQGEIKECLRITSVLDEIDLHTQIII
ncbi:MAG: ATP-dependent Clp protease adaptor ClpS [Ignavibacteriales bacterium]|nr:ATP-dependent Clp protease adaptor ClpS [Ignavibacteriales bacterium]MCF8314923.1 ATP-dependent Clp protease adaptor ClpS [Ignavibacteriales bacterium]MCF8436128.1 ATP-dependent Clp protease adaptor ClpS [Ignavibacteriales bacterium]